jgi:hypothetical protein
MIITQIKSKNEYNFEDNPDKDFMTECAKVDKDRPKTWEKYNSWTDILKMEVAEYEKYKTNKELYHIAVACLNIWRMNNDE